MTYVGVVCLCLSSNTALQENFSWPCKPNNCPCSGEADVEEFAGRGLHALAVAYEELDHISQALIFITRSHGLERLSYVLIGAFFLTQLVSSVIAAWADWGFSNIQGVDLTWISIIWVWVWTSFVHCLFVCLFHSVCCRTSFGSSCLISSSWGWRLLSSSISISVV